MNLFWFCLLFYVFIVLICLVVGVLGAIDSSYYGKDDEDFQKAMICIRWCWMPIVAVYKIIHKNLESFDGDD